MNDNWVTVFTTTEEFEAERVRELICAADIPAVVLNHKDSSYIIGEVEVMVNKLNEQEARGIIQKNIDRE